MWQLHQFTLCPFTRKVRTLLNEKDVGYQLVPEEPWKREDALLQLNPVGETPVMVDAERDVTLIDSVAICEYFEETVDRVAMINGTAANRAEIRRLVAFFDTHFYREVTQPLLQEKFLKRLVHRTTPDGGRLREALRASVQHIDYIDYLLDHRKWIAGATMSLADIAAVAQLSVADYLGGVDWTGHAHVKAWYAAFKSRRSFRPLLAERVRGIEPPDYYENPDF
jgi:glutathione S-transferase